MENAELIPHAYDKNTVQAVQVTSNTTCQKYKTMTHAAFVTNLICQPRLEISVTITGYHHQMRNDIIIQDGFVETRKDNYLTMLSEVYTIKCSITRLTNLNG